jgi:ATP-dependent RNA helicase RhlE
VKRALVFTRTKHGANRVAEFLDGRGVGAAAIHGNKSQGAREKALAGFKAGSIRVLVATDIAARGIDIDDITHVIQVDLPNVPEQYVHRIGRTARAGASGIAWAFCSNEERVLLRDIERDIRKKIDVVTAHPFMGAATSTDSHETRHPRTDDNRRHGHGRGRNRPHAQPSRGGSHGGGRGSAAPASSSSGPSSSATPAPARGRTRTFGPGRR